MLIKERALRIVYDDQLSTFDELLQKDNSFTVHERNIQTLAIEIYKVINGHYPKIMNEIFQLKENSNYCSKFPFKSENVRRVAYGTETLSFLGPKTMTTTSNKHDGYEVYVNQSGKVFLPV